jgi:hypothetical protein
VNGGHASASLGTQHRRVRELLILLARREPPPAGPRSQGRTPPRPGPTYDIRLTSPTPYPGGTDG